MKKATDTTVRERLAMRTQLYVCKKAHIERAYRISKYQRDLIVRLITAMCGFECANYEPPQSWVAAGYDLAVTEL